MSHPARDPRSGIAGKAMVTNRRHRASAADARGFGGGDMSHPARDPRSGIAGKAIAPAHRDSEAQI
jgi:hypothetical protein